MDKERRIENLQVRKRFLLPFLIGLFLIAAFFLWPGVWRKEGFEGLMANNVLQTAASLFSGTIFMYAYYSSDKEAKFLKFYGPRYACKHASVSHLDVRNLR